MKLTEYGRLGERVYTQTLDNGLRIYVAAKPEFTTCYAFFATRYGGNDTRFCLDGVWHDTPAGVAHFLEHKMFDTKDGNALQILAANGASPNAFTSNDITGYFFECTQGFEENLRTLLSFVSVPWFTQESVDKEQGIIGQEIRMYDDSPDWCVFINLMEAMYRSHPIRTNVAGSVESIAEITADTLYACHRAFYTPGNMVLCVAGDVDPDTVASIAAEILPAEKSGEIGRDYGPPEPDTVDRDYAGQTMAVSAPLFEMGVKLTPAGSGTDALRQQLLSTLACEVWLGTSSPLYARLYAEGLINDSFSYGYESCPGCAFLNAGGESRDPRKVYDELRGEAARLAEQGIDPDLWERLKKATYGAMVQKLNSFEYLCVSQAEAYFEGFDALDFPRVFEQLSAEDARSLLARCAKPEYTALSVIRPGGERG